LPKYKIKCVKIYNVIMNMTKIFIHWARSGTWTGVKNINVYNFIVNITVYFILYDNK